jgi:NADPH2:quinone reductase
MLAASYDRVGDARAVLTVADLPDPEPGPGEVRVRVAVSGVNPSDVKSRQGLRGGELPWPRIIPHSDGAGVIDRVGPGVAAARIGERVWLWNAQWKRPSGTAAQYIALPAAQAVTLPDGVGFAEGACLGIPARTAHRAVTIDGSVEGLVLLVAGGAGAVGHYAVQIAKAKGAIVITTAPPSARPRRRSTPGPRVRTT